jgi:hypothetical protein
LTDRTASATILALDGVLLVGKTLDVDDIDESLDNTSSMDTDGMDPNSKTDKQTSGQDNQLEVEDMLTEATTNDNNPTASSDSTHTFGQFIKVNSKDVIKSRALAQYSKY